MAKDKKVYFCNSCGNEFPTWYGKCPACGKYDTFTEELQSKSSKTKIRNKAGASKPEALFLVKTDEKERITSGITELDRVLGGGIVAGSMILVGGDPGIGKSTILLQVCKNLSDAGKEVLYVSGEESAAQIKLRADRIGTFTQNLMLLCETSLADIEGCIDDMKPDVVVVDSIQTMNDEDVDSAMGSVSQVRAVTNSLMNIAKGKGVTMFIIGHVTKEGVVAGPRVLEHMVDTVLYIEGDRHASYRLLRSVKNRFGATNEMGVFEMKEDGLKAVENPSEYMLNGRAENVSGSVISCLIEGTRPIMVEVQALLTKTNYGMARRTAAGADYNRLNLLLAVLEKRMGFKLSEYDAYLNVTGGLRISEPAIDLGIVMAVLSSYKDTVIPADTVAFGEVGLSGEVRSVSMPEARVAEAAKLGFKRCIMPKSSLEGIKIPKGIKCFGVSNVSEVVKI